MAQDLPFPLNIPLSELYQVVELSAANNPKVTIQPNKKEELLRQKIAELKTELENLKSRQSIVNTPAEETIVFVPIQEKILAPDGSLKENYLP